MKAWPRGVDPNVGALVSDFRKEIFPFARAERYIAATCMGTPFFLIIADSWQARSAWILFPLLALVPVLPALTAYIAIKLRKGHEGGTETHGFITAAAMLAALVVLAVVVYGLADFTVRPSISDYVSMSAAHIFGLLLTMASMLFITNGLVYMNRVAATSSKRHGRWYNIVLGSALLMVVVLPVTNDKAYPLHVAAAVTFFFGSAFCIAAFSEKRHQSSSRLIAGLMLLGFGLFLLNTWLAIAWLSPLTMFWAETLGLWVIGIHYILESLGELT